jgi:murein DD-endopeptidase MepM/ murein hydrolase activator NlpD
MRTLGKTILILCVGALFSNFIRRTMEPLKQHVDTDRLLMPVRVARLVARKPEKRLIMPLADIEVRSVANTWGAKRSAGRKHEGQDMFAPRGTPVYSAAKGIVLRIGDAGIGGKSVSVLGSGGRMFYYAHLSAYAEGLRIGDDVTPDSLLGYVGNTGNARATSPHLHFGVYSAGGAFNPLPLLVDRQSNPGVRSRTVQRAASERTPDATRTRGHRRPVTSD